MLGDSSIRQMFENPQSLKNIGNISRVEYYYLVFDCENDFNEDVKETGKIEATEYYKAGKITSRESYSDSGEISTTLKYDYIGDSIQLFYKDDENGKRNRYERTYLNSNKIRSCRFIDDALSYCATYEFDNHKNFISYKEYSRDGIVTGNTIHRYDDSGNRIFTSRTYKGIKYFQALYF